MNCCQNDPHFGGGHGKGGCCQGGGHGKHHGHHHGFPRHFITKDEQIQHLEKYRENLQKELKGLDEYLAEMKG